MLNWLNRLPPTRFALLLVLPSVVFLLGVIAYPLANLVRTSLATFDLSLTPSFSGLDNYREIFADPLFWRDLVRSLIYTFGSVAVFFTVGFAVALSLSKIDRLVALVRGVSLLPWAIPPVTAAMMWRWSLNSEYGMINDLLARVGLEPVGWLTRGPTAMGVLIFADAWIRIPFVALILFAGLQSIPKELYESAAIDGASAFQRFRHITLPNLRYPISIVLALQTMFAFRTFDIVSVLTGGGPGKATELLVKYVYDSAFQGFDFGVAAAASIFMLAVSVVFVGFYFRLLKVEV